MLFLCDFRSLHMISKFFRRCELSYNALGIFVIELFYIFFVIKLIINNFRHFSLCFGDMESLDLAMIAALLQLQILSTMTFRF